MASTIIDSAPLMVSFLDSLGDLEPENADTTSPPSLYLDLEGNNLGRNGSLTMIQVLVYPRNHVYLIDVLALGEKAFSTKGSNGDTFKEILESGVSATHKRSVGQDRSVDKKLERVYRRRSSTCEMIATPYIPISTSPFSASSTSS